MTPPILGPATDRILIGVFAMLVAATLVRGVARVARPGQGTRDRWASLGTWWVLALALGMILSLGRPAVVIAAAAISFLILGECLRLTAAERILPWAIPAVGGLYLWAWLDWASLFLGALPLTLGAFLLGEAGWRLRRSRPGEPLLTGSLVLVAVVGPSFVVAAASLPAPPALPREPIPWFLLLLLLTELNDVAQAWWGQTFGARPLAPALSPHKTWEGLVGGLATTMAAAALLAPMITSYGRDVPRSDGSGPSWMWSVGLGLLVGLAGLAGDLSASALKRRAGVEDSGRLLPGHGGVLDRFDSLAATAPAFFLLTWLLWFPPE